MTEEIKNNIHDLAVKQIITDFNHIKTKASEETIYGFALGIAGDLTGFFSAGNTLESLRRKANHMEEELHASDIWSISEWEYKGIGDNALYEYLETLIDTIGIDDMEDDDYDAIMKDYEEVLIKALVTCNKKGVFGQEKDREELIVYLQYADATDEDLDDNSSQHINSEKIHILFKERWNEEKNNLTKIILEKINRLPNMT